MKKLLMGLFLCAGLTVSAQETFPTNGVPDKRPEIYAFTNATLFIDYQTKIEKATLVIVDGQVKAAGAGIAVPKGAIVKDLNGKFVYPAVVDPYTTFGMPEVKSGGGFDNKPQYESKKEGAYGWNDAINSTFDANTEFQYAASQAEELRKSGIGAVVTHKADGIVRGSSLLVALSDAPMQEAVLDPQAGAHYSFSKGSSKQAYPSSIMGSVALLRQTFYDARWYATAKPNQTNLTLQAFNEIQALPQVFEASGTKLRVLLADKVGDEFGVQYIIKGNGDEYQRLQEIKATKARLIVPLSFPEAYDVEDPIKALDVSLADMKHWELAPSNAAMLAGAGVEFAFTTSSLKNTGDLWKNVRKAVEAGLTESQALYALTLAPAKFYRVDSRLGTLRPGSEANFFIASESIFSEKAKIMESWVQGKGFSYQNLDPQELSGKYDLQVNDQAYKLEISGEPQSYSAKIKTTDSTDLAVKLSVKENRVLITFSPEGASAPIRLTGWVNASGMAGTGFMEDGVTPATWNMTRTGDLEKKEEPKKEEEKKTNSVGSVIYPFVAYGWEQKPTQEILLIKNAIVWTMEGNEAPTQLDVLVKAGKISAVGKDLSAPEAKVVDGSGKHLTPGIIDEHSHIALSSVNEGSAAITGEVRMYDAVDSEDIDIYRQLAGGVTAAQLLHGSANPVGGQSALIKFRWGASPEGLKIEGADGFIKFALGENVKQANWGDNYDVRFPQTRMGVEQVFIDGFTRAKEYGVAKARYEALAPKVKAKTVAPRTDLQLETLLEIINSDRFITCHSYVQSEINMLMKVAEQFDFKINTFTHILEGYKVADKMAAHGVGGSTFSDWWAYKMEVKDAIPYNAALMTQAGVTVAINSDDAEMARRLNQEAAKAMLYGGLSEVEAMKLVTINPAKLLHLDDRMGSIKAGKDADLVLWSGNPLSIYSRPELTMVDGVVYFSLEKDKHLQATIAAERARLIQKMIEAKNGGAATQKPVKKEKHHFHCEDLVLDGATLTETEND